MKGLGVRVPSPAPRETAGQDWSAHGWPSSCTRSVDLRSVDGPQEVPAELAEATARLLLRRQIGGTRGHRIVSNLEIVRKVGNFRTIGEWVAPAQDTVLAVKPSPGIRTAQVLRLCAIFSQHAQP
jgi:hypothetical protein